MSDFFAGDYTGEPFVFFGTPHITVLVILALAILSLFWLRNAGERAKNSVRIGLGVILLVNELAWHLWNFAIGKWTLQTMLPLHLCSVLVFVSAFMLLTRSKGMYEFVYFLGIGAAIQAVLTPDLGVYGFPHFRFFQTFISHCSIVLAAFYMTLVDGLRPTWRSMLNVLVGGNIYMLIVTGINLLLGSNYMFTLHVPETPSLLDLLGPWPWYLLATEAVAGLVFLILYAPFAIKDWRDATAK